MASQYHNNQRLSLKDQLCTVRFVDNVKGKSGDWLGVEWDDPSRGKHNGCNGDTIYFTCRGNSPTCASFLRPDQSWDKSRTFLEALREKYVERADVGGEVVYFSSKQAEEVGFEKFAKRQAKLEGIKVLVLDHMNIRHSPSDPDIGTIGEVCSEITDLDIGGNLFESIHEVADLCRRMPKLKKLVLDGNRMVVDEDFLERKEDSAFVRIKDLSLSSTMLDWENEFHPLVHDHFVNIRDLSFTGNECRIIEPWEEALGSNISTLDLSNNDFESIDGLCGLSNAHIHTLILKNNKIHCMDDPVPMQHIMELDVRNNAISSFDFINSVPKAFPRLAHLRTAGNPLYANLTSPDGKALTSEDGYMLTIARLPQLKTLNYSKITEKERLNAETYYLNTIAQEVSKVSSKQEREEVISQHPRWEELCKEYGEPAILRQALAEETTGDASVDPNSLAARLITVTFISDKTTWSQEIPKSFSTYEVLGLVGKKLKTMPLKLRLLLETGERDLVVEGKDYSGPEWWCSDSESEDGLGSLATVQTHSSVSYIELVAGTRLLGTHVDDREARIKVEMR